MKKVVLAVLLALAGTATLAEWEAAGFNDQLTMYADRATIRRSGSLVKMWYLFDEKAIQTVAGKSFLSSRTHEEIDCKEELSRSRSFIVHSGQMGRGQVVYSSNKLGEWRRIPPKSFMATLWNIACVK